MIMTIVPRIVACIANFERIQSYLLESTRKNQRESTMEENYYSDQCGPAIRLHNVTVDTSQNTIPILQDINLEIRHQGLVICAGFIGSDKSVLAKTILGEIPLAFGTLEISSHRVSRSLCSAAMFHQYCTGCLSSASSHASFQYRPKQTVTDEVIVHALKRIGLWEHLSGADSLQDFTCVLDKKLPSLPVLSAGQTQLLSLARAITKRESFTMSQTSLTGVKPILLLDEATSSLDAVTEAVIHEAIDNEFVRNGHTTIIMTHRPNMLPVECVLEETRSCG
jgi:ATP-binding cassette, subfamily C (CFTR/MRP), member 1